MPDSRVHVHHDLESAYTAVRKSIAEKEARAATDAQFLVEREELPEAPPRRGPRRGRGRREYDARLHDFRAQELSRIIDEAAAPYRECLLEAAGCVMNDDRTGFESAVSRALSARVLEVTEWRRGVLVADLLQSGRNYEGEG